MSIDFVEPEAAVAAPAPPVVRSSPLPGRLLGGAAAVAGVLTVVAVQLTLYAVVRTASIIDFDGTTTLVARIPVDAFGHSSPVTLGSTQGVPLSDFTVEVSTRDGISYGAWWLGLGIALVLVGVWCLVRPRTSAPTAVVAALGGVLLGSVGAAWLAARAVAGTSVPQIRFTASPALGIWLVTAAGAVALVAAAIRVAAPHVHLRRRRL